jgi:hypothetical protein
MESPIFSRIAFTAQRMSDAANVAFWVGDNPSRQDYHLTVIRTAAVRLAELVAEMDAAMNEKDAA